tara:strand:+ start:1093 stop:1800 length:708 start_codon:yes stop_codon:yes gene_type:complete
MVKDYFYTSTLKSIPIFLITLCLGNILNIAELGGTESRNPLELYGGKIEFQVYREGKKAGFHTIEFSGEPNNLKVISKFNLSIKLLFITAYSFDYESHSIWKDGLLSRLQVNVNDNGDVFFLSATRVRNKMLISRENSKYQSDIPLFPTNHWNASVLNQTVVLNTLTGELNRVKIRDKGEETILSENGPIVARHYAYTGDLETQIWYDNKGRWVGMEFVGSDGSRIQYRCKSCVK